MEITPQITTFRDLGAWQAYASTSFTIPGFEPGRLFTATLRSARLKKDAIAAATEAFAEIVSRGQFIRLDTLETVRPEVILWGASTSAVQVRRPALFKVEGPGRVPYMPVSAMQAVRIVPALPLEARLARIAYLAARDGKGCFYCGQLLDLLACEVEHLVARSAGGPDHASNLCLACKECNAAAGHLPAVEKMQLALRLRLGTVPR